MQFIWATTPTVMPTYAVATSVTNFKVESCPALAQMLNTSKPVGKTSLCQIHWIVCYDV